MKKCWLFIFGPTSLYDIANLVFDAVDSHIPSTIQPCFQFFPRAAKVFLPTFKNVVYKTRGGTPWTLNNLCLSFFLPMEIIYLKMYKKKNPTTFDHDMRGTFTDFLYWSVHSILMEIGYWFEASDSWRHHWSFILEGQQTKFKHVTAGFGFCLNPNNKYGTTNNFFIASAKEVMFCQSWFDYKQHYSNNY